MHQVKVFLRIMSRLSSGIEYLLSRAVLLLSLI